MSLARKKQAGGLPDKVLLALTPTRLYAFGGSIKGYGFKVKKEVAVWQRSDLETSSEPRGGMTMLTIASPSEGEQANLVPIGVRDDPVALGLITALAGS